MSNKELLGQIVGQTLHVRFLQKEFFRARKGEGRYPTKASRSILDECRAQEVKLDTMLSEFTKIEES